MKYIQSQKLKSRSSSKFINEPKLNEYYYYPRYSNSSNEKFLEHEKFYHPSHINNLNLKFENPKNYSNAILESPNLTYKRKIHHRMPNIEGYRNIRKSEMRFLKNGNGSSNFYDSHKVKKFKKIKKSEGDRTNNLNSQYKENNNFENTSKEKINKFLKDKIISEVKKMLNILDFSNIILKKKQLKFAMEIDLQKDKDEILKTKIFFKNIGNLEIKRNVNLRNTFEDENPREYDLNMNKFDIDKELKYYQSKVKEQKFKDTLKNPKNEFESSQRFSYGKSGGMLDKTVQIKKRSEAYSVSDQMSENNDLKATIRNNQKLSEENLEEDVSDDNESYISFNDSFDEISLNNIRMRRKQRQIKAKEFENS
jgi:hypothetical protein